MMLQEKQLQGIGSQAIRKTHWIRLADPLNSPVQWNKFHSTQKRKAVQHQHKSANGMFGLFQTDHE